VPDDVGDGRPGLVVFARGGLADGETADEVPEMIEWLYANKSACLGASGRRRRLRAADAGSAAPFGAAHGVRRVHVLPCGSNVSCVFFGQSFDS